MDDKACVVMTGEGARGAYQAGLLKRLEMQNKIEIDMCYGISSGAVNSVYRGQYGLSGPCAMWQKVKSITNIYSISVNSILFGNGFLNAKPVYKRAKKLLSTEGFEDGCDWKIAIMDIEEARLFYLAKRVALEMETDLACDYVSSAVKIPGLVHVDRYADAGALELNPVGKAIADGYKTIHLITGVLPDQAKWVSPKRTLFRQLAYGFRSLDITMKLMMFDDLSKEIPKGVVIHVYGPTEMLGDQLAFKQCRDMLDKGLTAPYRHLSLTSKDDLASAYSKQIVVDDPLEF